MKKPGWHDGWILARWLCAGILFSIIQIATDIRANSGDITINATLDGKPWAPQDFPDLLFSVNGPTNWAYRYPGVRTLKGMPAGSYTIKFLQNGPQGASLLDISPNNNLTLAEGSTIAFTFNFGSIRGPASLGPLDDWQWRHPLPQGNHLRGVVFGNGIFVAVGDNIILNSRDGINWALVPRETLEDYSLYRVIYANGLFVAVGSVPFSRKIVMLTSSDGVRWNVRSLLIGNQQDYPEAHLFDIAYSSNKIVAVGGSTKLSAQGQPSSALIISSSIDGNGWNAQPVQSPYYLYSVTYASNVFRAVGSRDTLVSSSDGITWNVDKLKPPTQSSGVISGLILNRITYLNGTFMALNGGSFPGIWASLDGRSWYQRADLFGTGQGELWGITYVNNMFVGVGAGGIILTSADKVFVSTNSSFGTMRWTDHGRKTYDTLRDVAYGNNFLVAVGENGALLRSTNATDWIPFDFGSTVILSAITGHGSSLVAVGGRGPSISSIQRTVILVSTNSALTWQPRNSTIGIPLNSVLYADGKYVATGSGSFFGVGTDGVARNISTNVVLTSIDGDNWLREDFGASTNLPTKIARGGGMFAGIRQGNILSSIDGVDWSTQVAQTNEFSSWSSIAYGNNTFVAVGYPYGIWNSSDGNSWEPGTPTELQFGQGDFRSIAFGQGIFVVTTGNGLITSPDGKVWTLRISFDFATSYSSVLFSNGLFVIMGRGNNFLTSTDGLNWTRRKTESQATISDLIPVGDTFVAVGSGGTILQSGPLSGSFPTNVLALSGTVGSNTEGLFGVLVEASQNEVAQTSAITDSSGKYRLRDIPSGDYIVRASRTGYSTESKTIGATQSGSTTLNFILRTVDQGETAPLAITTAEVSNGQIHLRITGPAGKICVVETSANLIDWIIAGSEILVNGAADFRQEVVSRERFYRAVVK